MFWMFCVLCLKTLLVTKYALFQQTSHNNQYSLLDEQYLLNNVLKNLKHYTKDFWITRRQKKWTQLNNL